MKKQHLIALIATVLVAIGVSSRLIDHQPNFAAIGALAIAIGFYSKSKLGWAIPLGAMLISDLIIGFYAPGVMAAVYLGYLTMWGFGRFASTHEKKAAMFSYTLFGAIAYFFVTNAAVWAFTSMYPKTLAGLGTSYAMGVPFFKWSLAGDLFYLAVVVAVVETARYLATKPSQDKVVSLV